ncbi:carbohydrate ABC transporter permease [Actinopolymorpha pittospori]|uniref:Raffinose/stachyose/melibiose transport system permease protein n=1 Tax=Actinopolymorpha pittospori TaxID=648752 RepID=A0A927MYH3_9ACTN|nr:carbohydrate ABC transporter permease [Actinopolymorpha pittospori]MBE1607048.1 raffinose/stachyose/melibiose transport system permease protein [Actinopolymorpha pittospori]
MVTLATRPRNRTEPTRRPRRSRRGRTWLRLTLISAVLVPVCLVWIYPFLWMVSSSIKSNAEIFGGLGLFPSVIRLDNYVRAWQDAHIGSYFLNTVFVTVMSILISVPAVAMMGYVLGRYRFPGKRVVAGVLAAAIFLPEGYTIIPVFDLINKLHLQGSLWGITLAEAGGAHVVATLLFAGYFSQLPKELEEAAMLDGAGFLRIFWRIYLPLAKPVVATAIILQFMHSWNDFLLPLVLTLNQPDLRTLSVGIYSFQSQYFTDWSGMAAAATIGLLPIIVLFLFLQRYFVEGVAGAVK